MLSTLLTTAVVSAVSVLPLPVPSEPSSEPTPPAQEIAISGTLDAPSGRLKRGCKDYGYGYAVTSETEDWTFDITMQDRTGKGVNAQSLIGPNDAMSGVLPFRLCRWATKPGLFTLTGDLVAYEGTSKETHVKVTETFRLRRRHR